MIWAITVILICLAIIVFAVYVKAVDGDLNDVDWEGIYQEGIELGNKTIEETDDAHIDEKLDSLRSIESGLRANTSIPIFGRAADIELCKLEGMIESLERNKERQGK